MHIATDRILFRADTTVWRYLTVGVAAPASGGARDVDVNFRSYHASMNLLTDLPWERRSDGFGVGIGDLAPGQEVRLAVSVSFGRRAPGYIGKVEVFAHDRDRVLRTPWEVVKWTAVPASESDVQPVAVDVLLEVAEGMAARARREVPGLIDDGRAGEAGEILRDVVGHVRGMGPHSDALVHIANALEAEAARYGLSAHRP